MSGLVDIIETDWLVWGGLIIDVSLKVFDVSLKVFDVFYKVRDRWVYICPQNGKKSSHHVTPSARCLQNDIIIIE